MSVNLGGAWPTEGGEVLLSHAVRAGAPTWLHSATSEWCWVVGDGFTTVSGSSVLCEGSLCPVLSSFRSLVQDSLWGIGFPEKGNGSCWASSSLGLGVPACLFHCILSVQVIGPSWTPREEKLPPPCDRRRGMCDQARAGVNEG